jgi:multidrug efflux pump subunit AcrA (membrane-fusion protein)
MRLLTGRLKSAASPQDSKLSATGAVPIVPVFLALFQCALKPKIAVLSVENLSAMQASVDSYAANVRRLEDLVSFEKVCAPFDGVITVRNTDTGWLINAGAGSPSVELFQLAQTTTLRIFVAVPEVYSRAARIGATATLTLENIPMKRFAAESPGLPNPSTLHREPCL